jgi:hypothetical protein
MRLNMRPYTKEGIEYAEKLKAKDSAGSGNSKDSFELAYDEELMQLDDSDYEYDLYGVLVHSGVAQGGHYYSFIRDRDSPDKWCRYEDEDVTPFNPDHIPANCFGGTISSTTTYQGVPHTIEEDRHANALMLFYDKVRPCRMDKVIDTLGSTLIGQDADTGSPEHTSTSRVPSPGATQPLESDESDAIDGYGAFQPEVDDSNLKHVVASYLLDNDFHTFLRDLLSLVSENALSGFSQLHWSPNDEAGHICLELTQFCVHFLLDIILHSR